MLRVIEYFAKSVNVTQGHSKCSVRQIAYEFLLVFHGNYGPDIVSFLR